MKGPYTSDGLSDPQTAAATANEVHTNCRKLPTHNVRRDPKPDGRDKHNAAGQSSVLHRTLHELPKKAVKSSGLILTLDDGQEIIDATGGAAVACLGHGNEVVKQAVIDQMNAVSYCHSLFYGTSAGEALAESLIASTDYQMARAFIVSSGSEAMEAAAKMARQYFLELTPPQSKRCRFIARRQSYHGTTLGSLSIGGHVARRELYEPLLSTNTSHVSPCYAYRGMGEGESVESYVARLAKELDEEFQRVGPDTVCAFVAEPIVGAALGCVPFVPGYFKAMKAVCDRYGALLILDEVMCGMGRCGTLHAWQDEGVCPDIQTIGKGLGGGYAPVAGMLVSHKVIDVLSKGTGAFSHGQTYQGHPVACAAALAVNKIVREPGMMEKVRESGKRLEGILRKRLEGHEYVGDIRGKGLFWGIEFVRDKWTKEPFDPLLKVALGVHDLGMEEPYSISLYPGNGTVDGKRGDHILVAPPYNSTSEEIDLIGTRTADVVEKFFKIHADKLSTGKEPTHQVNNDTPAASFVERLEESGNASTLAPTG
jgi:adenosylmethionine-8-amino-7-oxononanoate aminotransferase